MRRLLLLLALFSPSVAHPNAAAQSVSGFQSSQPSRSSTPPEPVEIVALEQHMWTTFAEGDFNTVRALFAPDYLQVGGKIEALDSAVIFLKHCKLVSYDLKDLQVRILTPDSAMTAYHVVSSFECDLTEKPEVRNLDDNSVTVWVRHGAKWLVEAHTETPTETTASTADGRG